MLTLPHAPVVTQLFSHDQQMLHDAKHSYV